MVIRGYIMDTSANIILHDLYNCNLTVYNVFFLNN